VTTQTTRRRRTETELSLRARGILAGLQIQTLHLVPRKRRRRRAWELLRSWKRRRKIKRRRRRPKREAIVDFIFSRLFVNFEKLGADKCWDIWPSELDWVLALPHRDRTFLPVAARGPRIALGSSYSPGSSYSSWSSYSQGPRIPRVLVFPGSSCVKTSHKSSEKLTAMRKDKKLGPGAKILSRKIGQWNHFSDGPSQTKSDQQLLFYNKISLAPKKLLFPFWKKMFSENADSNLRPPIVPSSVPISPL